ncbi:hypothetical protein [Tenacibaculum soleae]|uniref:hypothetical protein n=1 Tax=Tenacibaculum soleae TaxID=447689 RepID=UPI002301A1FA|nr:hypothetical protein [Tenacibaculum soleae]
MEENQDKKESKGCLITAGVVFGLIAINPLLTLIFGGDPRSLEGVDYDIGETYSVLSNLRLAFIALVIALIYYIWAHSIKNGKE